MKKLSMLFVALTVGVGAWAQQQQPTSATTTKVNTDLSKYKTFAWAKSDPTAVGPNGYDIWFYEVTPTTPGEINRDRSNDMNRDRSNDINKDRSTDINREPSSDINRDRSSDVNRDRSTDVNRDRSTDVNRDRSTDANQSSDINRDRSTDVNKDRESSSYRKPSETDQNRRSDTNGNNPSDTYNKSDAYGNKPSGYIYSYNVIIPSSIDQTNTTIKEGVENELIGRGYRENESSPDLLVVYQVFDQKATLHGYEPGTPTGTMGGQVYQPSDTTSFVLEPGTLMVSLIDAKTSQMVWNGFSSGLVNNSAFTTEDADLKEAIHTIFEKFQNQADKAKRD